MNPTVHLEYAIKHLSVGTEGFWVHVKGDCLFINGKSSFHIYLAMAQDKNHLNKFPEMKVCFFITKKITEECVKPLAYRVKRLNSSWW